MSSKPIVQNSTSGILSVSLETHISQGSIEATCQKIKVSLKVEKSLP